VLKTHFAEDVLLFADKQIITAESEDKLPEVLCELNQTVRKRYLNISSEQTKVIAFNGVESEQRVLWTER